MGQINSNLDSEQTVDATSNGDTTSAGDNDATGSGVKTNRPAASGGDSIQCVKSRIDMLIEDCLNIKDDSSSDSEDKNVKTKMQNIKKNVQDSQEECKTLGKVIGDGSENRKSMTTVDSKEDTNNESSEQSNIDGSTASKNDEKGSVIKMSDLISDMAKKELLTTQKKKNITTFKTFIDKVLDTSLRECENDPDLDDNKPKNILKMCNESLLPSSKSGETNLGDKKGGAENSSKTDSETKVTPANIRTDKKITLKDHIERFLEASFQEESFSMVDKKQDNDGKKEKTVTKNGVTDKFNAQCLVNNMITQGLQINKLLSPPLNRSRDPQKSPNIRQIAAPEKDNYIGNVSQKPVYRSDGRAVNSTNTRAPDRNDHIPFHEMNRKDIRNTNNRDDVSTRQGHVGNYVHQNSNPIHSVSMSPKNYSPYARPSPGDGRDLHDPRDDPRERDYREKEIRESHLMNARMQEQRMDQAYRDAHLESINERKDSQSKYMHHLNYKPPMPFQVHHPEPHSHGSSMPEHLLPQASGMYPTHQYSPRNVSTMPYHPSVVKGQPSPGMEQHSPGSHRSNKYQMDRREYSTNPMAIPPSRQQLELLEQKAMEHRKQRSPHVPMMSQDMSGHGRSHLTDQSPAMMRPSHAALPPGFAGYPNMPKLLPHHPPITSAKEFSPQATAMSPQMYHGKGMAQGRRPIRQENQLGYMYPQQRNEEYAHNEMVDQYGRALDRMSPRQTFPSRPSSEPSQDPSATSHDSNFQSRRHYTYSEPSNNIKVPSKRPNTQSSGSSSSSGEAPLDLSVKKPKEAPERPRSSSYGNAYQASTVNAQTKINPSNTFLKHLENSVDKYCQELHSPSTSPGYKPLPRQQVPNPQQHVRSVTPNNKSSMLQYSHQSPHDNSPQSQYNNMIQSRSLPSPHYSGGITLGQPLVDNKSHGMQRPMEFQYNLVPPGASPQSQPYPAQTPPQPGIVTSPTQTQFTNDMNSKRNANNISKHEPIQNIIGNHDPNDILYLICRLCTQTYGSPYGFRKHFRNQHGFEPRSEHTIVQTISATKSALHHNPIGGLQSTVSIQGTTELTISETSPQPSIKTEIKELNIGHGQYTSDTDIKSRSSSASPANIRTKSNSSSEEGDKNLSLEKIKQLENSETKFLECPNCGKTFQLNDFGSYKRHCRQHGNLRMTGPYTCSDCHLSFPDQKSLKEHFIGHVQDPHSPGGSEKKNIEIKTESLQTCFSCVSCEKQFEDINLYNSHMKTHVVTKTENENSSGADMSTLCSNTSKPDEQCKTITHPVVKIEIKKEKDTWPDMMLNVVPSQSIVKSAAQSNTSVEAPDSSWDSDTKPVVESSNDKVVETTTTENLDSGLSSSLSSNATLSTEDKSQEKGECGVEISRQKSSDSNSNSNSEMPEDKSSDTGINDRYYKHKKFFLHRKRESSDNSLSSQSSNDVSQPKVAKLSAPELSTKGGSLPVTSSTSLTITDTCDSSDCTTDTKLTTETLISEKSDVSAKTDLSMPDTCSKQEKMAEKLPKEEGLSQPEARHNLPFVCDTRTRRSRKTK